MFAVFQIEKTKEYQATIYMEQDAAFKAMTEMQSFNPDTKFEIRQFSHVEKLTGKKAWQTIGHRLQYKNNERHF